MKSRKDKELERILAKKSRLTPTDRMMHDVDMISFVKYKDLQECSERFLNTFGDKK